MKKNWVKAVCLAAVLGVSVWSANLFAGAGVTYDEAATAQMDDMPARRGIFGSRVSATTLVPLVVLSVLFASMLKQNR